MRENLKMELWIEDLEARSTKRTKDIESEEKGESFLVSVGL